MTTDLRLEMMRHFYDQIPGFFWFEECYRRLLAALPNDRPSRFVELGSFLGRSTCWLGVEILNSGKPVTLCAVDSFVGLEPQDPHGPSLYDMFCQNVAPLRRALGDQFMVWPLSSLEAVELFADASCDVVFVDASHKYEDVMADISAWWPKLKSGGWMAGDDWNMKPVADAVIESFGPQGYILCHGWATNPGPMPWPSWMARRP